MEKYHLITFFLLLISFLGIDAFAQTRNNVRDLIERIERKRQVDLEKKLSETICNSSWLREATGEDVLSEVAVSRNPITNWLHSSRLQADLRNFVSSNDPCDEETGNRPLHLALYAGADVIEVLVYFGADPSVPNNERVVPIQEAPDLFE